MAPAPGPGLGGTGGRGGQQAASTIAPTLKPVQETDAPLRDKMVDGGLSVPSVEC